MRSGFRLRLGQSSFKEETMMCEECKKICEIEKKLQSLKDAQKYLDMFIELKEQFDCMAEALHSK